MTGSGEAHGEGVRKKNAEGTAAGEPQGAERYLGAGRGRQRGRQTTQDTEADTGLRRGAQRERRRLEGGGRGRHPGGRNYVPGKEVGSGYK